MKILIILSLFIQVSFALDKVKDQEAINSILKLQNVRIDFVEIKEGAWAVASDKSKLYFLFKKNAETDWKIFDKFEGNSDVSYKIKKDTIIINLVEGGSSHSDVNSIWRFEKDQMKVIGQDSDIYIANANPFAEVYSVNYLTGKMTVTRSFSNNTFKKAICHFKVDSYKNQKISDMTMNGVIDPDCQKNGRATLPSKVEPVVTRKHLDWEYADGYKVDLKKSIEERAIDLSVGLIQAVSQSTNSYVQEVDGKKKKEEAVKKIIAGFPSEFKKSLSERTFGWALVNNLGGNFLSFTLFDKDDKPNRSLLLIDDSILGKTYAEVCTEREGRVYVKGAFELRCESSKDLSSLSGAFVHLLSESALTAKFASGNIDDSDYAKLSWEWDKKINAIVTKDVTLRNFNKRLYFSLSPTYATANDLIPIHFDQWKSSHFASFFALRSPIDDWMDSNDIFLLNKYFGAEVSFSLFKDGKLVESQKSCLFNGKCGERETMIKGIW
jgi:hypothetical protein